MIYRTPGYTAQCSVCNATLACSFAQTKREAKQFFKDCDWVFRRGDSYCKNCAKVAK